LREIISWFEKLFLPQRGTKKNIFLVFIFQFLTDKKAFSIGQKLLTQRKMMKVFHFSCCSFRLDKKNDFLVFAILFWQTRVISKTKIPDIYSFTV